VYACILFGLTQVLLFRPFGFALLAVALVGMFTIYWVIDPKLRAVSSEYESRQAHYLENLETRHRWDTEG
jgi:hypothetical protein